MNHPVKVNIAKLIVGERRLVYYNILQLILFGLEVYGYLVSFHINIS